MIRAHRKRVLLVAHHANPEWTSEALIGWRWVTHLDPLVDLTLVTHVRNRPAIERSGHEGLRVFYVDTERLAAPIHRLNDRLWKSANSLNRTLLDAISLRQFDREACRIAKQLVARGEIDVIHRVSPISPRIPTKLGTCGVPFVLGPLNGGMSLPPGYDDIAKQDRSRFHRLRRLARLTDLFGRTFSDADRILCATNSTMSLVAVRHRDRAQILCENAIQPGTYIQEAERSSEVFRILYVGRLMPVKAVNRLVAAVGLLRARGHAVHLDVVGDGELRQDLENQMRAEQLEASITFHGHVPHAEVARYMAACHVFCLPSVRESGGAVVLEAMAAGRAVVAINHGGPAETVLPTTGTLVSPSPGATLAERLAEAIRELIEDPERRRKMEQQARQTAVRLHTWQSRAQTVANIYDDVCAARATRASA